MIKIITIDLDGTLLTSEKKITEHTIQTLRKAKAQGVRVVLCTGRPLTFIMDLIDQIGLQDPGDYSITFNGGLIQKNDTGEIVAEHTISKSQIEQFLAVTSSLDLPLDAINMETVYQIVDAQGKTISQYGSINPKMNYKQVSFKELPDIPFNKLVVATDADFLMNQVKKMPPEIHNTFNLMKSRPILLEVVLREIGKDKAIAQLIDLLGIKQEEVMAIGDEENDLAMIQYAGLGVAMGNASETVKKAADVITKTNDADGVAAAVEEYVLKKQS